MIKINLMTLICSGIRKHPMLVELLKKAAHKVSPETVVLLNYPVNSRRRWDQENPHQDLYNIINKNRESYKSNLQVL